MENKSQAATPHTTMDTPYFGGIAPTPKPQTVKRHDIKPYAAVKTDDILRWRNAAEFKDRRSSHGSTESLGLVAADFAGTLNKRRRKSSNPHLGPSWQRRWSNPEFAETDRRVDLLLKYGGALRQKYTNLPTDNKSPPLKTIRTLADFMIEIPKKPRFSSFMSPEAQYSLMKGYEDTLYRRLSNSVPDYKALLKRNKTPNSKIDIKTKNTLSFLDSSDDEDEDDDDDDDKNDVDDEGSVTGQDKMTTSSFLTQPNNLSPDSYPQGKFLKTKVTSCHCPSVRTESSCVQTDVSTDSDQKTLLRSLRRLSVSLEKGGTTSKAFHEEEGDEEEDICSIFIPVRRSCSLPNVSRLATDRRLAMAYRLQAAMDILDNLRPDGEVKLSPRLKVKRGTALAEYNAWVTEWNKEFCIRMRNE